MFTGAIAFFLPQVMGIGYDTVDLALEAQMGVYLLLGIGIANYSLPPSVVEWECPLALLAPPWLLVHA